MLCITVQTNSSSFHELQVDINSISKWMSINLRSLNTDKCKCILLTNIRSSDYHHFAEQTKGTNILVLPLQLLFTGPHILSIYANLQQRSWEQFKANHSSSPHVILQLYLSLVCPSLQYVSQVWDPHLSKNAKLLENVQTFALRIATKQQ